MRRRKNLWFRGYPRKGAEDSTIPAVEGRILHTFFLRIVYQKWRILPISRSRKGQRTREEAAEGWRRELQRGKREETEKRKFEWLTERAGRSEPVWSLSGAEGSPSSVHTLPGRGS